MDADIILPANGVKKPANDKAYIGKSIAETIVNGFFTVDKKWTVQYWNKAAEKILKVSAADITGKNLWEVFADRIPLEFYAVYHKAFEKNIPVHFREYWGEMGDWFDVITFYCDNTLSVSFKTSNHSVDFAFAASLEQQLQIKTGLYKFITEVTNDCLWEWDLFTKEMFWIDGGHKRVFGYEVENALIPREFWEGLIHPDDRTRVLSVLSRAIEENTGTNWDVEYRFKKAGDEYAWVHDRGHFIHKEGRACRMIGATQDITEKVQLQKRLEAERLAWQKETTCTLLSVLEKERATVGKELLDNVNQILGAAKLYIEMAKKDELNRDFLLEDSGNYIMQVMERISRISKALSPPFIRLMGLVKSIKILTDDVAAGYRVTFTINDYGMDPEIPDEKMQLDIFRIVQQQVNNILQYANATLANIDISREDDEIVLFVADNGNGCDLTQRKTGNGINDIIFRASQYNGTVTTLSSPGEGYTLQVILRPDEGDMHTNMLV